MPLRKHFPRWAHHFVAFSHITILLLILSTIILLLAFTAYDIYDIGRDLLTGKSTRNFLRDIAYVIVLVKAYRVLLFYFETLHISIRYIVEISIVAPAIEIVFASHTKEWWLLLLLGGFSLCNLIVYLRYYEQIVNIDEGAMAKKVAT